MERSLMNYMVNHFIGSEDIKKVILMFKIFD